MGLWERFPPSSPLPRVPSLPLPSLPLPPLPLEVAPNTARGSVGAVSSPSGLWGGAPAEIEFGAF